jgi:hypothetical protein
MNKQICAAVIAAAIVGAPIAAFAQAPNLPSYNGWSGVVPETAPAYATSIAPSEGPRPSSLNNWPGMTPEFAPANESSADPVLEGPRPSGH